MGAIRIPVCCTGVHQDQGVGRNGVTAAVDGERVWYLSCGFGENW